MARANFTNVARKLLLEDASIRNAVDQRVRPDAPRQGEALPAIRYMTLRDRPEHGVGGTSTLRKNRTQFDVYASTRAEADEIGGLIEDVLDGVAGDTLGIHIDDCMLDNSYASHDTPAPGSDELRYIRTLDFESSYQSEALPTS